MIDPQGELNGGTSVSTITMDQERRICEYVQSHHLPPGLGSKDEACSVAAINLALTGELTDIIPDCMSEVVGQWVICVQDAIPDALRNSRGWKLLLPLAAGTGRAYEAERLALVMDWMWERLTSIQGVAEANGFGVAWRRMTTERTAAAASGAWSAAAAGYAAVAAWSASWAAAAGAGFAATAAAAAARAAVGAEFWRDADPVRLLGRLIAVSMPVREVECV